MHRKDGFGEVCARTPLLAGVQFLIGRDENAVLIESRGYRLQTLARIVQQLLDLAAYGNELGPRSHAVRPHVHRAGVQLCGQAGLLEDAALESQQAELPVEIKRWVLQIGHVGRGRVPGFTVAGGFGTGCFRLSLPAPMPRPFLGHRFAVRYDILISHDWVALGLHPARRQQTAAGEVARLRPYSIGALIRAERR
jgi:hypothetical protein